MLSHALKMSPEAQASHPHITISKPGKKGIFKALFCFCFCFFLTFNKICSRRPWPTFFLYPIDQSWVISTQRLINQKQSGIELPRLTWTNGESCPGVAEGLNLPRTRIAIYYLNIVVMPSTDKKHGNQRSLPAHSWMPSLSALSMADPCCSHRSVHF